MNRFVFFNSEAPFDAKALGAAKKVAKRHGATVVRAMVGSMLLEGSPEVVERVAAALPGWRCEPERFLRLPEIPSAGRRALATRTPLKKAGGDTKG